MFCQNCGSNLNEQGKCPNCEPVIPVNNVNVANNNYQQQYNYAQPTKKEDHDSYATIAFVCGLLGILGMPFLGIVAWIFGNKYRETGEKSNLQLADIGRILGIVSTVIMAISLVLIILYFVFVFGFLGLGMMAGLSA